MVRLTTSMCSTGTEMGSSVKQRPLDIYRHVTGESNGRPDRGRVVDNNVRFSGPGRSTTMD